MKIMVSKNGRVFGLSDILNFFINMLKVVIITYLGQRQKSA